MAPPRPSWLWAVGLHSRATRAASRSAHRRGGATSNVLSLSCCRPWPSPLARRRRGCSWRCRPNQTPRILAASAADRDCTSPSASPTATWTKPHAEGAVVQKTRSGPQLPGAARRPHTRVIERHYALVPQQRSGALSVPALRFAAVPSASDPGGHVLWSRPQRSPPVRTRSLHCTLRKPAARAAGLAAGAPLDYSAQGPDAGTAARVGEASHPTPGPPARRPGIRAVARADPPRAGRRRRLPGQTRHAPDDNSAAKTTSYRCHASQMRLAAPADRRRPVRDDASGGRSIHPPRIWHRSWQQLRAQLRRWQLATAVLLALV